MKCFLFSLGILVLAASSFAERTIEISKTPGGVEYGVWGKAPEKSAPILFILSGTIVGTLESDYFRQSGNELVEDGFLCVSLDLPLHGLQAVEGIPNGLAGWAALAGEGKNIVEQSNARLSEVLDYLLENGVADPEKIAVCGTSRGGFLAVHFLAHDPRVKCAAAFAPVTDPSQLREFAGKEDLSVTRQMNLAHEAEALAGKPVWIVIGDQDERVDTASVIGCAQAITKASVAAGVDSRVELHVMPEPRGHSTPEGSASEAAIWIRKQIFVSTR